MTLHGEDTIISIRPIWGDRKALTGSTINASTITGLTGMKVGHYNGGKMFVLDGNQEGKVYNIVSNTATIITVDVSNLNKTGGALATTDSVSLWPYKAYSDDTDRWILVDSSDLPTPKNEVLDIWAHQSGITNTRESSVIGKKTLDATLVITPQNGAVFPFMFGKSVDTAATEATNPLDTTLSSDIKIGETVLPCVGVANATDADYIRIGSATEGEVRKIMVPAAGSHTGGDNELTVMTDSAADFPTDSRLVGLIITNTTDGSTGTITSNTATSITCAAGLAGGADNDWDTSDAYTLVDGTNIYIDKPLRRSHDSGATVDEMEDAAGTIFTHTYSMGYDSAFRQWPFMISQVYNTTGNPEDDLIQMFWCQVKGFNIRNDGDKLQLSISVIGYDYNYLEGYILGAHDGGANQTSFQDASEDFTPYGPRTGMTIENDTDDSTATISEIATAEIKGTLTGGTDDDWDDDDVAKLSLAFSPTKPDPFQIPIYWNSSIEVKGVVDGYIRTVNIDVDYGAEGRYYHNSGSSKYPGEIIFQRPKITSTLGVRINNRKFLDLLCKDAESDNKATYYLNAAQTQSIEIDIQDSQVTEVPHNLPPGGPIETDLNLSTERIIVVVKDTTQYW